MMPWGWAIVFPNEQGIIAHAQLFQRDLDHSGVQDAQDTFFSVGRGQGRHAQIQSAHTTTVYFSDCLVYRPYPSPGLAIRH